MTASDSTPPVKANSADNQGQTVAVIVLVVVLAFIIGGLYLAQATTNITTTQEIEQLDEARGRLQRDNERLRADIARQQNLDGMHTRAAELGFEPADPDDIQYIVVDGYTYNQPVPSPTIVQITATPEEYEENFAGWLKRQFDGLSSQFRKWSN
jgi:hypothetical protein